MDNRINDSLAEQIFGSCECGASVKDGKEKASGGSDTSWGLKNYPLGMVYAPIQEFEGIYDLDKALEAGTVFKALDLPFMGKTVTKGGGCRG